MTLKDQLFHDGVQLMERFCAHNHIRLPAIKRLVLGKDRLYELATCGFYRPWTIHLMVEKCAAPGHGGRAWS